MATTNFCEMAARYLDIVEVDGLEAAAEMASESHWSATYCEEDCDEVKEAYCPWIDCLSFISQKLEAMCQERWDSLDKVEETPAPSVQSPESAATLLKIADIRAYYGAKVRKQLRHMICSAVNNSYRYAVQGIKYFHFVVVTTTGDRLDLYTQNALTINQAMFEFSPYYSVRTINGCV